MKKIMLMAAVASLGVAVSSCDSFFEDNRYPDTLIINNPGYWSNTANCQLQVDRYIDELNPGYGSGGSGGWFYFSTLNDDQVGSSFADWPNTSVPSKDGNWDYGQIRGANYILEGIASASPALSKADRANFEGIAKLIRANAYYKLVRMFGDVVWESGVVDPAHTEILYGPRISRDVAIDSVMADLEYAINGIATESSKLSWSKDLALAMKCEVALYEGTFCKYRTQADNGLAPDPERAKVYLQKCVDAATILMNKYGFSDDYQSIYNSVWSGMDSPVVPGAKITSFSANPEIIFGRNYDKNNGRHSLVSYTCSSTTTSGMSLDAFKSFLFLDGKPAASTSYNTSLVGENTKITNGDEVSPAYSIQKLLDVRDKRLSIITDPYIYYSPMFWSRAGATGMNSSSGFGIAKYDNVLLAVSDRNMSANNYTCAPIYWTSYIYLNYAEAKAELGTLTDADLDKTLNKLYKRAGLPTQTMASLSAINDPANNMNVSSLLWEIRRCRRCELMFDNNIRYYDLIRWHQLDKLDSNKYPDVLRGAYVGNADVKPSIVDDGYMRAYNVNREFSPKYYLRPIPSEQLDLNNQLAQNPGWK